MDHNEDLTVDDICNKNEHHSLETTKVEKEEEDNATVEPSELIPATPLLLTPPPTGEPMVNGSSRSSISGNDIQLDFTVDEVTQQSPVLSHHTDEGNSNQSANSDSVDTKLIINEGSIDSDDISNIVDHKMLKTPNDVQCENISLSIENNQTEETFELRNRISDQVILATEYSSIRDVKKNKTLPPCINMNMNLTPEPVDHDADEKDHINTIECKKHHEIENHHTTEECENVPSQSINGVACEDGELTSTHHLANETRTEHRSLKRRLSDPALDPYETPQKRMKLNNQKNSIVLSVNQLDEDDSLSKHTFNHKDVTKSYDNLINSDVQTNHNLPTVHARSQENADENFERDHSHEELLSITKDKNINEYGHIYMNGHTATKAETLSTIKAPEKYKQQEQLEFNSTNDLDENIQSNFSTPKLSQPFETLLQNEAQSCDNNDKPTDKVETSFQNDVIEEKSSKAMVSFDIHDITTKLTQIPCNYEIIPNTMLKNTSIGERTAFTRCMPDGKKSMNVSNEIILQPSRTSSHIQSGAKKINTHTRIRRQVFLCSACGTYYEKWNLFYHIREVHNKFICLFENCLGIFPNAERLVNHLESKHVHKPFVYEHKDDLLRSLRNQCFLMCCVCEHIFTEDDDVTAHSCETFMKPCSVCGLKFIHKSNCSALLSSKSSKHKHKRTAIISNTIQPVMPSTVQNNNIKSISSQMFLRNALLGQEPRVNRSVDYQISPDDAQIPMFNHSLNILPPHHLHLQPQPQPQPVPATNQMPITQITTMNGSIPQQSTLILALHSQLDTRYSTPNTAIGTALNVPTKSGLDLEKIPMAGKTNNQNQSISNSESSSDSDDTNNDSDSSSADSNAENENKENGSKRVIKPFRINLNNTKNNINTGKQISYSEEPNDSANEGDSFDNDNNVTNNLTDKKCHPNMSDITNIQMQLDSIQQQMHAMQRNEESQTSLKVPKLKLKLSKPFQNLIESEQSSTESDSDSENQNDEEGHVSQGNASNDIILNEREMDSKQTSIVQPNTEMQHYPYNASESTSNANQNNKIFIGSVNESRNESNPSMKNSSTDLEKPCFIKSNGCKASQELPMPTRDFMNHLNQMQILPPIQTIQEQTTDMRQTTVAQDENNIININENYYPSLEHNQNVMTPPDSILDGQPGTENDNHTGSTVNAPDTSEEKQEQVNIDVDINTDVPQIIEDKRPITEFILDQPLDRIPNISFLRKCLQFTYPNCLYCNHARSIAVSGVSLAEHLIEEHRFSATVDSITAEELLPETIEQKITTALDELTDTFFNMDTYDSQIVDQNYQYVKHFECFQCRFYSPVYKDLYLHNRKMHLRSALICLMCRSNFYSYSELVCHMCPGTQTKLIPIDLKFRCVLCNLDDIPSAFRLMVHLRKKHFACDVCLEECSDQSKLSCHVWKHKLHHLCYRCNITYRNKVDITRHLFWKHGTESVMCKRCLEKKWPHVYHFCVPPASFKCEICNLTFSKALALKVHKRLHDATYMNTYACTLDDCDQKFVSKKLMIKHISLHYMPELPPPSEEKNQQQEDKNSLSRDIVQGVTSRSNSPLHSPNRNSTKGIEQEAPIDAVISVIEHDAREREEKEKLLKQELSSDRNELAGERLNQKTKSRKLKKNRSDFSDLLDLPTVNLSESDSSEDSDVESNTPQDPSAENSRHSIPALSIPFIETTTTTKLKNNAAATTEEDDDKVALMLEADIWENFKTYQANQIQDKSIDLADEDRLVAENPVLLHVSQSDHDYPMMYKPLVKKPKVSNVEHTPSCAPIIEENERGDIRITLIEPELSPSPTILGIQSLAPLPVQSIVTITHDEVLTKEENDMENPDEKIYTDMELKNENKSDRKANDSDSSSDSSDSDSSCSCGSNCSCSSSSSSSSSSTTDSGSDSSSSVEGKRKKVLSRTRKSPEIRTKQEKKPGENAKLQPKEDLPTQNVSIDPTINSKFENDIEQQPEESETIDVGKPPDLEIVDVVTTTGDTEVATQPNIYTMVAESDLETTESETDEEFYDEHPQKLSIQMLAEKRQQLMLQTLNPVNGMPYMSTSRPSTPLLPEEQLVKGQKTKTKKRRRTHKNSRSPQKQVMTITNLLRSNPYELKQVLPNTELPAVKLLETTTTTLPTIVSLTSSQTAIPEKICQFMGSRIDASQHIINSTLNEPIATSISLEPLPNNNIPATLPLHKKNPMRLSTSSCSDADSSLKRSKRRRIPNKFYGYTSDEESMSAASTLNSSYQNPFKPTPPPNLTWSKEDLPKPSSKNNRTGTLKKILRLSKSTKIPKQCKISLKGTPKRSPGMKNRTLAKIKEKMRMTASTPTVPKIIIRGIPRPANQPIYSTPNQSTSSNAIRVPSLTSPPKLNSTQYDDQTSDSDSDENLHISQTSSRINFNKSISDEKSNRNISINTGSQIRTHQIPFIRPDHTLLPPKRFSLSPSPPPQSSTTPSSQQNSQNEHLSSMMSSIQQNPLFNGVQHKSKQESTRNDSNLYCYCRRPYDEMSEMIACDAQDCSIEWFHFECVSLTTIPIGKWFCPQCRQARSTTHNNYMTSNNVINNTNSNHYTPTSLDLV